jgi:hypothetical protein
MLAFTGGKYTLFRCYLPHILQQFRVQEKAFSSQKHWLLSCFECQGFLPECFTTGI